MFGNWQQYPFYVRIEITTNVSAPISVAGALLNDSFALTTARHLRYNLLQFPRNDLYIRVVAGERSDLWGSCRQSRQQSQVREGKSLAGTHSNSHVEVTVPLIIHFVSAIFVRVTSIVLAVCCRSQY